LLLFRPSPHARAADDRRALIAIYRAMGGPNWKKEAGWTTDAPLGTC
jgi:hypothetical protein